MTNDINVVSLAYLAAFIEASGSINVLKFEDKKNGVSYYCTQLRIHNQDPRLMQWLQDTFGGTVYTVKENPNYRLYRPELVWRPKSQDIFELGTILSPYMFIKKRDLELMVKIRLTYVNGNRKMYGKNDEEITHQREKCYLEFREIFEQRINHKGQRRERE